MKSTKTFVRFVAAACSVLVALSGGASAFAATNYVALGDSFSSGVGSGMVPGQPVENYLVYGNTLNACDRSVRAYPVKVAAAHKFKLTNVSCSGAVTDNILTAGQFGEPAQITAVTPGTNLVTLTIGGNDIGFSDILVCVLTTNCTNTAPTMATAFSEIPVVQIKVENILGAIHAQAPGAKIILGGYPRLVPQAGRPQLGCIGWLSQAEQSSVNQLETMLDSALQSAVSHAAGTGINVAYVNPLAPTSPFEGHDWLGQTFDACSLSTQRQINGIRADFPGATFHPNQYGQQSYTILFNAAL